NVAAEFRLNPLTVLKGYQQLVDEQLVEKRRGRGMYVNAGARKALMKDERQRFIEDEWPKVYATIQRLGLSTDELFAQTPAVTQTLSTVGSTDDKHERHARNRRAQTRQVLRQAARPRRHRFQGRRRPHRGPDRPERRRQDHGAQGHPRPDPVRGRTEGPRA